MGRIPMENAAFPSALTGESGAPGMLRIRRGEQVRWIWPVHLPGWMALGWNVAQRSESVLDGSPKREHVTVAGALAEAEAPKPAGDLGRVVVDATAPTTTDQKEAQLISSPVNGRPGRQRRGKRRDGEETTPAQAAEVAAGSGATAVAAPAADTELITETAEVSAIEETTAVGAADPSAACGIDDLLLDPLL